MQSQEESQKVTGMIGDVSDTALWVAVYRAVETERPDALFRDPLASRLAGERGREIARHMGGSRYTEWTLVMRTLVIDDFILQLLREGVSTVVNLGAGLDARPYRLDIPPALRWVEVDFPHIIEHKTRLLKDEQPRCRLERVPLDLTDRQARKEFFKAISQNSAGRVLILTEGVTPYLSDDEVGRLADDLREQKNFAFWINDYFSRRLLARINRWRLFRRKLKNAPFRFAPIDWFTFFASHGWKVRDIRYLFAEAERRGRPMPVPWWGRILRMVLGKKGRDEFRKMMAYVVLTPASME